MTDPTPEQIEAAAAAYEEHGKHTRYYDNRVCTECDEYFKGRAAFEAHRWAASLAAAAGVTPQDPGAAKAIYISPSLPGMIRNLWKSDPSENSVRTALKLAGDLIQELIDIRAASVQVEEAELAEVTRVTLVGRAGERSAEHWDYAGVKLSVQDDGRTLKILPLRGGGR